MEKERINEISKLIEENHNLVTSIKALHELKKKFNPDPQSYLYNMIENEILKIYYDLCKKYYYYNVTAQLLEHEKELFYTTPLPFERYKEITLILENEMDEIRDEFKRQIEAL